MSLSKTKIRIKKDVDTTCSNDNAFYIRMQGDAMLDAGIYDDDLLRVNTDAVAREGNIVLALVERDLVVRRYFLNKGRPMLMADNVNLPCMIIEEHDDFEICGVVEKL
jgi:DNA polymerase V